MAAISDIQEWISVNKKLYTRLAKFIATPSYTYFTKSEASPHLTSFAVLMRSWKSRVGTFENSKWAIEGLSDKDLDLAGLIVSKDFFNRTAADTKSSLDLTRAKNYIEKGLEYLEMAYSYAKTVDKYYSGWGRDEAMIPVEILAIGGASMILLALQPYHLFSHFAWHSTNTKKIKDPGEIVVSYYEFFSDPQWSKIMNYVDLTIKSAVIPNLLEKISVAGTANTPDGVRTLDKVVTHADARAITRHWEDNLNRGDSLVKLVGNNASKLFIDTYSAT